MACPIGCGATFDDLQHFRDHLDNSHSKLLAKQGRGSEVTDAKSTKVFLVSHVFDTTSFGRIVGATLNTAPESVCFMHSETSIPSENGQAEPIEISVVDGDGSIIVDTIIDHGLTVEEMFAKYSIPGVRDRRHFTLMKVVGSPHSERIPGLTPNEIVQILRQAGVNKNSILIESESTVAATRRGLLNLDQSAVVATLGLRVSIRKLGQRVIMATSSLGG
jgi:hypothetical protein